MRSLRNFVRQAWPIVEGNEFVPGWHIDCICEHLEAVSRGQIRNLLINVPPRSGKSTLVSIMWPAWEWITQPQTRWLFNSYSENLSVRDAIRSRRIIQSQWYQSRWGTVYQLSGDQNLKHRYENTKTGFRIATSVTGSNTGEGGDRIVADDPHNVRDGESDLMRETVLQWWDEVMSTRLNNPNTSARVVVMQRVHQEDLSGHILEKGGFHHLCLPARYEVPVMIEGGIPEPGSLAHKCCEIYEDPRTEEGEVLWEGRFGDDVLVSLERDMGMYAAAGQLQQRPVPRAGAMFRPDWFRELPKEFYVAKDNRKSLYDGLNLAQYWDLAFSEKESADWTVGLFGGIDSSSNIYILGMFRDRVDETSLDLAIAGSINVLKPRLVGIEESAFKQASVRDLVKRVQQNLAVPAGVQTVKVTTDKVFRAQLPAGRARAGLIYVDKKARWWPTMEKELLTFPKGKNDDIVDALSGLCQLLVEKGTRATRTSQSYSFDAREKRESGQWDPFAAYQKVTVVER